MNELVMTLMTYLAVPLTAWSLFMRLYRSMEAKGVFDPPNVQFFLIFTVYGGWAMIFFILLVGAWAGWMIMLLIYLVMVAPILMLGVSLSIISNYRDSSYHTWALVASGIYVGFYALIIFIGILSLVAGG